MTLIKRERRKRSVTFQRLSDAGRQIVLSGLSADKTYAAIIKELHISTGETVTDSSLQRFWRDYYRPPPPSIGNGLDATVREILEQVDNGEPWAIYSLIVHKGRPVIAKRESLSEEKVSEILKDINREEMEELKRWKQNRKLLTELRAYLRNQRASQSPDEESETAPSLPT